MYIIIKREFRIKWIIAVKIHFQNTKNITQLNLNSNRLKLFVQIENLILVFLNLKKGNIKYNNNKMYNHQNMVFNHPNLQEKQLNNL